MNTIQRESERTLRARRQTLLDMIADKEQAKRNVLKDVTVIDGKIAELRAAVAEVDSYLAGGE